MLQFFRTYTDSLFLSQAVRELEKKGRKTPNPEELGDKPSIGIILCKEKNRTIVEYALQSSTSPIGVATYRMVRELPRELRDQLPGPEEIARLLEDGE